MHQLVLIMHLSIVSYLNYVLFVKHIKHPNTFESTFTSCTHFTTKSTLSFEFSEMKGYKLFYHTSFLLYSLPLTFAVARDA